ncbi:unnamed protein product [Rhodiola kirilowii]
MDQTLENLTEEFIDEFCFDDTEDNRLLELYHEVYGQSSRSAPRKSIFRDHESGHQRLENDYFSPNPVYSEEIFHRRFRMGRHVFLLLWKLFQTLIHTFVKGSMLVEKKSEYLRKPNSDDIQRLLQMGEAHGFPGMMGSIDCMHWQWKNCPKAWKGMFMSGHKGVATILLEAVASSDLWIWHTFFGVAGSNNDINVLDRSPVFDEVMQGRAPEVNYTINGNNYNMGYYLTDGIYPEWATFFKTIPRPQGENRKLFSKYQESQRKDVERAFGVLQSRFTIVRGPSRFWDKADLGRIMRACIIIHNMIVEDERDTYITQFGPLPTYDDVTHGLSQPNLGEEPLVPYEAYIQKTIQMRDKRTHRQLQNDLIEHISQFDNNR